MTITTHQQTFAKLGNLQLADYNPRHMSDEQLDKLVDSLLKFGFVEPVVARQSDLLVIGGHQRLAASKLALERAGLDAQDFNVPTVLVDVTDTEAKALNLALNRISGEWDFDKLTPILEELRTSIGTDLTGFGETEIDEILRTMGDLVPLPDDLPDPDDMLAAEKRCFVFKFDSEEDADLVRVALAKFGMQGPSTANAALLAMTKAAVGNDKGD